MRGSSGGKHPRRHPITHNHNTTNNTKQENLTIKTSNTRKNTTFEIHNPQTDEQRQREFDNLARLASEGDRRAIGAIAIAIGPLLLKEARAGLGEFEQEAGNVLHDLFVSLLERRTRFVPGHARAMPWMCGIVQTIAQQRRRERERE